MTEQQCPDGVEFIYSPFKPWFSFDYGAPADCWTGAICTLTPADEARKQQFAATALVMGLLPLVLRDIAWPERRIVLVPAPLPALAEVIVRALGLEPRITSDPGDWKKDDVERWMSWIQSSWLATFALRSGLVAIILSTLALVVSFGALALIEVYSKRSALGCVYPIFGLTWCVLGVLPAAVHVIFVVRRRGKEKELGGSGGRASAVQGADEAWPVQFAWAVYYIAGTLVYTSIMAITPLELFVWVVVMFAVTGASKLLALYICLVLRNPLVDSRLD
ncbi:uncharacterized protein BJX67DRAFT_149242 [Aspergillus lucknowensis]|uniref:Yip1 domain-containing protein n=1 Tax=Aspergillus lucknowensis TaxID=176173 RepID=A0ABR4LN16_9EURO